MAGENRAWLMIIILSVRIWGIYWPLERLLAKGFHMINDAAQCQEEAAANILSPSRLKLGSSAPARLYSPGVAMKPVCVKWQLVITWL